MRITTLVFTVLAASAAVARADSTTRSPAVLEGLLASYDAMPPGPGRDALADRIDRTAGQRYATVSRMFWYTDLAAAQAEAARTGKPILSLRLLGRLDEELSCANSRYFRIALYANQALSKWLRDHFVLHWSSERPVPKITIDFGDGRVLERTITGNSIHYVLDAQGRPIDALPGLYAPAVFQQELAGSLALARELATKPAGARSHWLAELHRQKRAARAKQWHAIDRVQVAWRGGGYRPDALIQLSTTITKSGIEAPMYEVIDLGVDVGDLPDDANAWAEVGRRLLPGTSPRRRGILDASSKALLAKLEPQLWGTKTANADAFNFQLLVSRFERDILADTAINEFQLRTQIHELFEHQQPRALEPLNTAIYRDVFHTPATDPWLGLVPWGVLALPHDGLRQADADADRHVRR